MRLLRSNRFNQMQIRFDEKPPTEYREKLHNAGWKWRQAEEIWTMQLDSEQKWRAHADAERLFYEIGNGIRADLNLPPATYIDR